MEGVSTRADGGSASSQAADLDDRSWTARPAMSFSIRALVFATPLLGSLATTYVYRAIVPAPAGLLPTIAWWTGAIATVMVSMRMFDHSARRLLPVAVLFRMSLAFPDNAPNRFKTALKTGTTRQLQRQLDEIEDGTATTTPNEAAETLLALIARLSTHDRQTRGHSERVRGYTDLIAKEMDLPAADREKLHWAALIHDVGKLRVPPEILNKKGQPTDEEWEILKSHPGAGERLVDPLRGWLGDWALATTQHHERYDGKGYPKGLAGTEISLAGRIVSVADAYDVMTATRSYKKPLPAPQARAELTKNAGTQFDPAVVRAFLAVGLGKTRAFLGPLAWLTELRGLMQVPAAATTSVGTVAAAAVTAAAVSVGSVMAIGGPTDISSTEPVERVVEEPPGPALETTDESFAGRCRGRPAGGATTRLPDPHRDHDDNDRRRPIDHNDYAIDHHPDRPRSRRLRRRHPPLRRPRPPPRRRPRSRRLPRPPPRRRFRSRRQPHHRWVRVRSTTLRQCRAARLTSRFSTTTPRMDLRSTWRPFR